MSQKFFLIDSIPNRSGFQETIVRFRPGPCYAPAGSPSRFILARWAISFFGDTPMTDRSIRRAAERKARKLARKSAAKQEAAGSGLAAVAATLETHEFDLPTPPPDHICFDPELPENKEPLAPSPARL